MRIVKCKFGKRAEMEAVPGFVYCGRKFGGFDASVLANEVGKGLGHEAAIQAYRAWLWAERQGKARAAWQAIAALSKDAVLGCWCCNKDVAGEGPEQCHCDVIAKAWRWLKRG